jgi:glycine cleavage system aminomethyltransferase T
VQGQLPLDTITGRAGAIVKSRIGVPAHYGSPAGELAVCVRGAGLVDRSDLTKLDITGSRDALDAVVRRLTEYELMPGGFASTNAAYWCSVAPDRVIVLAEPSELLPRETIRGIGGADIEVTDRSADWSAIGLLGRATLSVLAVLGMVAEPRRARPFGHAVVAGVPARLLLRSDRHATVLVEAPGAAQVWRAVEAAGRPFGLSYVGVDAERRFALLERMTAGASLDAAG